MVKDKKVNLQSNKDRAKAISDDIELWTKKLNAIMYASSDGPAPQTIKMALLKKMADNWRSNFLAEFGENGVRQLEKADDFLTDLFASGIAKTVRTDQDGRRI